VEKNNPNSVLYTHSQHTHPVDTKTNTDTVTTGNIKKSDNSIFFRTSVPTNNVNVYKGTTSLTHLPIPSEEEIETNLAKYKHKKPEIDTTLANLHTTHTLVQHQIHNNILTNETNEILKESLQIQMTMAQYLKGIYDLTKLVYINGIPTRVDNTNKDKQEIEKELNQIEDNKIKPIIDHPSKPVFSVNIEHF